MKKNSSGKVESVEAEDNTENKDFKKTLKVTWLSDDEEKSPKTPVVLVYYDHIISKPILDKDDDFKNFVNKDSKYEVEMIGDPELKSVKRGEKVQVQRRGYFVCDVEYRPYNPSVGRARPVVLICIPDGTVDSYGPPGKKSSSSAVTPGKKAAAKTEKKGKTEGVKTTSSAGVRSSSALLVLCILLQVAGLPALPRQFNSVPESMTVTAGDEAENTNELKSFHPKD